MTIRTNLSQEPANALVKAMMGGGTYSATEVKKSKAEEHDLWRVVDDLKNIKFFPTSKSSYRTLINDFLSDKRVQDLVDSILKRSSKSKKTIPAKRLVTISDDSTGTGRVSNATFNNILKALKANAIEQLVWGATRGGGGISDLALYELGQARDKGLLGDFIGALLTKNLTGSVIELLKTFKQQKGIQTMNLGRDASTFMIHKSYVENAACGPEVTKKAIDRVMDVLHLPDATQRHILKHTNFAECNSSEINYDPKNAHSQKEVEILVKGGFFEQAIDCMCNVSPPNKEMIKALLEGGEVRFAAWALKLHWGDIAGTMAKQILPMLVAQDNYTLDPDLFDVPILVRSGKAETNKWFIVLDNFLRNSGDPKAIEKGLFRLRTEKALQKNPPTT